MWIYLPQKNLVETSGKYIETQRTKILKKTSSQKKLQQLEENGVTWSVCVEVQYYIFIILITRYIHHLKPWIVVVAFIIIACAWRSFFFHLLEGSPPREIRVYTTGQLPGYIAFI